MTVEKKFNPVELAVLKDIILKRRPGLAMILDQLGESPLSIDQREEIRELLADELCESGLGPDDEPNARGVLIDRMIGRLMYY